MKTKLVTVVITFLFIFISCKDDSKVMLVKTFEVSEITSSTAKFNGEIESVGEKMIEYGFYYSVSPNEHTRKISLGIPKGEGEFTINVQELKRDNEYYVTAFGYDGVNFVYGQSVPFKTLSGEIELTTELATNITSDSVKLNAVIDNFAGSQILKYGFYWSQFTLTPDSRDSSIVFENNIDLNSYSVTLSNLNPNTKYFFRAFVTNEYGTFFGAVKEFLTDYGPVLFSNGLSNNTTNFSSGLQTVIETLGGQTLVEKGFYISETNQDPNENDFKVIDLNANVDLIDVVVNDLKKNSTYYFRAYVKTNIGINKGKVYFFKTSNNDDLIKDVDGNVYKTVLIGEQRWMAQNLATTRFADGSNIAYIDNGTQWVANSKSEMMPAYSWYDGSNESKEEFGALYNFTAAGRKVANSSGFVQGACPDGWHLPADDEWKILENYLGMSKFQSDNTDWRGFSEGDMLKSVTGWMNFGNGSDLYGFNLKPGGTLNQNYSYKGIDAYLWSATPSNTKDNYVWCRKFSYYKISIFRYEYFKGVGFSVRCVQD